MTSRELFGRDILVVEDETLIALELRAALEAAGATVVVKTVKSAAQAIEQHHGQKGQALARIEARPGLDRGTAHMHLVKWQWLRQR